MLQQPMKMPDMISREVMGKKLGGIAEKILKKTLHLLWLSSGGSPR